MLFYAPQVYRKQHPEVTVLDPPDAVRHVHNRQSMLEDVAELNLSNCYGKVGVPKQLVILRDPSSIPDAVISAELNLPLVAKPLVSDGSVKSHQLSLAYNLYALSKLEPPLVLQEFVNHGGVLFKVFIVGDAIKVVRRFSLPDVNKCEPSNDAGVYKFPRVSSATSSADEADLDPSIAEHPPKPLLEMLAKELHERLGLQLFNIDIIREHGTKDKYYVIDINYFPGYGKMPGYEHIFTDFLLSLVQSKYSKQKKNLDK
ncbi:Inositol-tetrakisphosphate 1-kinase [Zostera marina]|uniref:inositol-1,3,4-trisphosphate 5/6-kinase n=1 Tax=Zostera marina TaxID=29655 RepID=A0A0K9NJ76_ZOSMR|nr:Inositol-tetrakisphosphate 1-kinase [Zostera marina]